MNYQVYTNSRTLYGDYYKSPADMSHYFISSLSLQYGDEYVGLLCVF